MSEQEMHLDRSRAHLVDEHDDQARVVELAKLRDAARESGDESVASMYARRIERVHARRRVALKRAEVHALLAIAYALKDGGRA